MLYYFIGLKNQFYKFNANCSDEEKGDKEGPGSCGGNTSKEIQEFIGFKLDDTFNNDIATKVTRPELIKYINPRLQRELDSLITNLNIITTPSEKIALQKYTNYGYANINEYLSNNKMESFDNETISKVKKDINKLDNIFKSSELPNNIITYRGISDDIIVNNPDLKDALDTPGSEIIFKCFTSSSILPFVAENFASGYSSQMLEIQLPKGSKAIYLAGVSLSPSEFEVLINRDTKYQVIETKIVKIANPYKKNNERNIKVTTLKAII